MEWHNQNSVRPSGIHNREGHCVYGFRLRFIVVVGSVLCGGSLHAVEVAKPLTNAIPATRTNTPQVSPPGAGPLTWKDLQALEQEGSRFTAAQAEAIEAQLKTNPQDDDARARLFGYYVSHAAKTNVFPAARVYAQAVEASPESLLVNPFGLNLFNPLWNDERCFKTVARKWIDAVQRQATNPVVLARAGAFLMGSPAFHQYAEQGEGLLQKACQLQPQDPTWPLALADLYLRDATPRFDKPAGNPAAAKRALACLNTAWPVMSESMRNSYRPNVRERLALAAFWAGEYEQARKYAQDWLEQPRPASSSPDTANALQPKPWELDRALAVHDANMILGQIALSKGKTKQAIEFLLATVKTPGTPSLSSYGPDMALARDLLEKGERTAVIEFLDACAAFWKSDGGSLAQWKKTIQAGKTPDFGPGFKFRFNKPKL